MAWSSCYLQARQACEIELYQGLESRLGHEHQGAGSIPKRPGHALHQIYILWEVLILLRNTFPYMQLKLRKNGRLPRQLKFFDAIRYRNYTHTHICTHTNTHTHRHAHTSTHTRTHTHTHTHTYTCKHIHTHTHVQTITHRQRNMHKYTHADTHTHRHTHKMVDNDNLINKSPDADYHC